MRFPKINGNRHGSITIPGISGGVNQADNPETIDPTQSPLIVNMWYRDGELRSFPNVNYIGNLNFGGADVQYINEREMVVTNTVPVTGEDYYAWTAVDVTNGDYNFLQADSLYISGDYGNKPTSLVMKTATDGSDQWYAVFSGGDFAKRVKVSSMYNWEAVDPYIPEVIVDGRGSPTEDVAGSVKYFEPYNKLTRKYRASYTTDGEGVAFFIPSRSVGTFSVSWTMHNGSNSSADKVLEDSSDPSNPAVITVNDFIKVADIGYSTDDYANDVHCTIRRTSSAAGFYFLVTLKLKPVGSTQYSVTVAPPAFVQNNLTFTVQQEVNRDLDIYRMQFATWFGGDRSGVAGGTRLFVSGNPKKPNLVCWSSLNDPTYFPENNYAYIGSSDSPVTGFGKQGDTLCIFKPHEIYGANYVADTAEYQDGQDVEAIVAKFPITPIHSTIGCDCPNTIRLVNNRLVWHNSNAKAYMLTSINQYNERNVSLVSTQNGLWGVLNKNNACSCEFCGYYVTSNGNGTYALLNCDSSAFNSFSYYGSQEKAINLLSWFFGSTKENRELIGMVSDGDKITALVRWDNSSIFIYTVEDGIFDTSHTLITHFENCWGQYVVRTKDFVMHDISKKSRVQSVYMRCKALGEKPSGIDGRLHIDYGTKVYIVSGTAGMYYGSVELSGDEEIRQFGEEIMRLTPNVNRSRTFSMEIFSNRPFSLGEIKINYSEQGVVR